MFNIFKRFILYWFLSSFVGLNALVELPQVEVNDLIITEKLIRTSTNSILSILKFVKPENSSRIKEYSILHRYFVSVTLEDSNNLKRIARLTRVDHKKFNNSTKNLTAIVNELLNENLYEPKSNETAAEDHDNDVIQYVDRFLAKLEALKELYGVDKVFTDINTNIIKLFKEANESQLIPETNNLTSQVVNNTVIASNEFWEPSGRRIYKGERTKIKHFPFMASIHIFNTFQCAGSIIKSDLIISASSCLQLAWNNRFYRENPAFLSVRVGSSFYTGGGENIPVLEIYFHPDYNPKSLRNNICLLRLIRHIKFRPKNRRKVRKILIDKKPWNLPVDIPGVTIIGWGAKGPSNILADPWKNILSYASLDVYPLKECQEVYSREYVTRKNFCAGFFSKGGGACNRDVGAPGVVDGILMGVVSFGSPTCGTPDAPTVFTKLGYYSHWIEQIMKLDVPHTKKKTTLKYDFTPHIITTPSTTTTIKLRLLKKGEKAPYYPIGDENFLRNYDDKLFQEFVTSVFSSDELGEYENKVKYQNSFNKQAKDIAGKNINVKKELINPITEKYTTVAYNDNSNKSHILFTVGYAPESEEYVSTTAYVPKIDDDFETEEYFYTTEYTPEAQESFHKTKYIPVQEHTPKIERNLQVTNYAPIKENHFTKLTTSKPIDTPKEIFLELATESSDDSNDSDQLQSGIKNAISFNKSTEDSISGDISDVPEEQAIAELLDEIDLNQILKELSPNLTIPSKSSFQSLSKDSTRNRFVISHTTTETPFKKNNKNNLRNLNFQNDVNGENDSVLTSLYLSDNEKQDKTNQYIGDIGMINGKKDILNTHQESIKKDSVPRACKDCNKMYNLVPKSQFYKIISQVLRAANINKNIDT
ncbi:unnamed protein product [Parnassius mnemosyne]|uniref:Peptidase S1 domain-containing protein n=1 Tax=Parnassius mnemosyne TaxID=213953 RepID=A0AAV1L9C6_9NEOP